jgi:hypothetical protein
MSVLANQEYPIGIVKGDYCNSAGVHQHIAFNFLTVEVHHVAAH